MKSTDKMLGKYVIVRANRAGVFAGILAEKDGNEVTLTDCRRVWFWDGAASISQLAMDGTSKPRECKFPAPVNEICVLGVIEIIPTTEKAEKSLREVPVWSK